MIIYVRVKTNSLKQGVEKFSSDRYLIHVKSPAENNEANVEMLNMLSKYLGTSWANIKIKSGLTSRDKILEIK